MKNKIKFFLKVVDYFNPPIVQFSPIRSGSTLVYNIIKEVLPNKRIYKRHKLNEKFNEKSKVVITYRHPIDCLASSMKRYDAKINRENIDYHINEIKENGFNDLLKVFNNEKYLKLKYELFYNDFEVIYKAIEDFFNIKISKQTKEKLNKAYNTDEVIKKTSKFENFEDYDKDNFFHGKHVSDTKGSPYAFKDYFNQEDLTYIENELNPIIKKLEY